MFSQLAIMMGITIASCFGNQVGQQPDLQPMLTIGERLFSDEPNFECVKKLYCLQAINAPENSTNPIKALARLHRSNNEAFEKIGKGVLHLSHMQAAMDAIDIGERFQAKSRCQTAYPNCPVSSDELEIVEEKILEGKIEEQHGRTKRASACTWACTGTGVACGIITFFTLGLGAPCFATTLGCAAGSVALC